MATEILHAHDGDEKARKRVTEIYMPALGLQTWEAAEEVFARESMLIMMGSILGRMKL